MHLTRNEGSKQNTLTPLNSKDKFSATAKEKQKIKIWLKQDNLAITNQHKHQKPQRFNG